MSVRNAHKPSGINNAFVEWQAKHKKVHVYLNDQRGPFNYLDDYTAYFYAKKYPVRKDGPVDVSIVMSSYDNSLGKVTFDLFSPTTNIDVGDYVYQVKLYDKGKDEFWTILQDRFTIIESLDSSYGLGFFNIEESNIYLSYGEPSANITINSVADIGWEIDSPSFGTVTPNIGSGYSILTVECTSTNQYAPLETLTATSQYGSDSVNVNYEYVEMEASLYLMSFEEDSSIQYNAINPTNNFLKNTWYVYSKPSWISIEPSSGGPGGWDDVSILSDSSTSQEGSIIVRSEQDYSVHNEAGRQISPDISIGVFYDVSVSLVPYGHSFIYEADASIYLDLSTNQSYLIWDISIDSFYQDYFTFNPSSGVGDTSILLTHIGANDVSVYGTFDIITNNAGILKDISVSYVFNTQDPSDYMALWTFDNNLDDLSGNDFDLSNVQGSIYPVSYDIGKINQSAYFTTNFKTYADCIFPDNPGQYNGVFSCATTDASSIVNLFKDFEPHSILFWVKMDTSTYDGRAYPPYHGGSSAVECIFSSSGEELNMLDIKVAQNSMLTVRRGDWGYAEDGLISVDQVQVDDGEWHFFAYTFDGSLSSVYWDGDYIVEDTSIGNDIPLESDRIFFGCEYYKNCNFPAPPIGLYGTKARHPYMGYIDQARIFNRALSFNELEGLWNGGLGI